MTIQTTTPHHRGTYHFSPSSHWMNDPNGMVYWDGEYHLFFQHHPFGDKWGPMHWGHAVSRDLVNWEELNIALEPDELGTIFSGSAVVDWNNTTGFFPDEPGLVAIFTHHLERPNEPTVQSQSLAYSHDRGRTWIKYAGNPVLTSLNDPDFRDPKVFWHEESRHWIMILACGQEVQLYRSEDLKSWTFSSTFGEGIGSHEGVWECPDLFELALDGDPARRQWVMLVSIGDPGSGMEGSRTQYFTGTFDGQTFIPDEASQDIRWLDYGRDNYAGVSWSDLPIEDDRRLYLGWMSNWRYANHTPTDGWRGAMTIPRELTLETADDRVMLIQRPVVELEAARTPLLELENVSLAALNEAFAPLRLGSYELEIRAKLGDSFGFRLREGNGCVTLVGIDVQAGELYLDRSRSGESAFHEHFAQRHSAPLPEVGTVEQADQIEQSGAESVGMMLEEGERRLHIFVDRSSVEVFEGDGRLAMTDLIFPAEEAEGLSAFADGEMEFHSVKVYRLQALESRAAAGSAGAAEQMQAGKLVHSAVDVGIDAGNTSHEPNRAAGSSAPEDQAVQAAVLAAASRQGGEDR
ncbi:glycoside hydrolase [Saccharibacillus sp. O16]|nr:glycoside hydrolase [Saccharibacillus sp. O16]